MNTEIICTPGTGAFEVKNLTSGNTRPQDWFLRWTSGGHTSDSGVEVNGYTALTHCPLWQGVNIIAGDIGQVPIRLVRNEFEDQKQHNAWQLLRVRPNDLQSPSLWKETMIQWALIWGNGVSWTPRRGSLITDLIPLRPDCLWPELVAFDDGQILLYHYISLSTGKNYVFFPDEVVHIQGLTGDGVWGYALHDIAKNTIGHGLALEKHGNLSFANGAQPSGVLEHPSKLPPEARANLRREWEQIHGGADNAGRIAILWEGMKFNATSMTNIDAQWIEAKKLDRVNAASLLNLPAHKLNALEDSSVRSNLEEQNEVYKQMTLTRWSNRMDEEFRRKLLTDAEWKQDEYQFVFDWDTFLRADIDTLTSVGDRCVKAEIMNRNEARRLIRLPPYEGGEKFGSPAINPMEADTEKMDAKAIGDILQSVYLAVVNGVISPNEAREIARNAGADLPDLPDGDKVERSGVVRSRGGGGESDDTETPPKAPATATNAHRALLVDRVQHLIERESHNLRRAADAKLLREDGQAKNFVEWLDGFYEGNGVPSKFTGIFDSIVGKSLTAAVSAGVKAENLPPLVHSWALERRRTILEACSHVTPIDLPNLIDAFISKDPSAVAEQLVGAALGDNGGN